MDQKERDQMKTLFIIRGLPGSGKTTLAKLLAPTANCSADHFMVNEKGEYHYDPDKLMFCHDACQETIKNLMRHSFGPVAVHNTFSRRWEMEPYYDLASRYGYSVHVIETQGRWQNVHGVPPERIEEMRARWESVDQIRSAHGEGDGTRLEG